MKTTQRQIVAKIDPVPADEAAGHAEGPAMTTGKLQTILQL